MSDHTREPFGPIRETDATDGWLLEGDYREWRLAKTVEHAQVRAVVRATTSTTVGWAVSQAGQLRREASALGVDDAKVTADKWLQEYIQPASEQP